MIQRIHHSSSLIFGQSKQEHDKHSCMEMQHLYDAVMQNDVIALAPRLHYVYSESNQGEKAFLAAQYYGKCQICGKQIFRSNGKPYFEACNILPTMLFQIGTNIAFQKVGILFVYVLTVLLNLSTEKRICLSLFR